MITTELIQTLKTVAIAKGLCKSWQDKFTKTLTVKTLVKMYEKGMDFCINNDYPSLDFLRKACKGITEPYGVYIDETNLLLNNQKTVVLNGSCWGTLNYDGYSFSRLYVRHDSRVNINIADNAILIIDAFDNAKISISTYGSSKSIIHTHCKAEVKIIKAGARASIQTTHTDKNRY